MGADRRFQFKPIIFIKKPSKKLALIKNYNVYFNYTFEMEEAMEASVVDLRYRMHDVLAALDRNEEVKVSYRGALKGIIIPVRRKTAKRVSGTHPAFGMWRDDQRSVDEVMSTLRRERVFP